MTKINIQTENLIKKQIDDYYSFNIKKKFTPEQNYKIIFNSADDTIIQFKLNGKLISNISIKYNDYEYIYNKLTYSGVLVNCEINKNNNLQLLINPIDIASKINIWDLKILNIKSTHTISWDKIYIINLKRRLDRKNDMINKLEKACITNYEFIEAVDGQDIEIINQYNKIKNNTDIINVGHYACLLSHIKVITLAKQNNFNNIMILEDDVIFNNNFINNIFKIKIPYFDLLYLGGLITQKKIFVNNWAKTKKIMGAYAYIINHTIYDSILKKLYKFRDCVDVVYYKLSERYNVYILNDFIKTNLDSSDTSHKKKILVNMIDLINK